jgi:hypothetical protein
VNSLCAIRQPTSQGAPALATPPQFLSFLITRLDFLAWKVMVPASAPIAPSDSITTIEEKSNHRPYAMLDFLSNLPISYAVSWLGMSRV